MHWSIQNSISAECIIWWRKQIWWIWIYSDSSSTLKSLHRQRREGDRSGVFLLLSFHGSGVAWSGQVPLVFGREQVPELILPLRAESVPCFQTFLWSSILRCHWLGWGWAQHGQFRWEQQSGWEPVREPGFYTKLYEHFCLNLTVGIQEVLSPVITFSRLVVSHPLFPVCLCCFPEW